LSAGIDAFSNCSKDEPRADLTPDGTPDVTPDVYGMRRSGMRQASGITLLAVSGLRFGHLKHIRILHGH